MSAPQSRRVRGHATREYREYGGARITHQQVLGLIAVRYGDLLSRAANHVLRDQNQAQYAVLDAYASLLRRPWVVTSTDHLRRRLYTIARNRALDLLRRQQSGKRGQTESLDQLRDANGREAADTAQLSSTDDAAIAAADAAIISACLEQMKNQPDNAVASRK